MSCAIRRVWYGVASVAAMHEIFSSRGSYTGEPLLPYYRNGVFPHFPVGIGSGLGRDARGEVASVFFPPVALGFPVFTVATSPRCVPF